MIRLCVLFSLIYISIAYPSDNSDQTIDLNGQKSESNEINTDEIVIDSDYEEKMLKIFNIPTVDRRIHLDNCTNIMCMPHYLCINDMVVTNGTELIEQRISDRMDVDKSNIICDDMEMPCCADQAMKQLHQPKQQNDETNNEATNDDTDDDYNNEINTNVENMTSNVVRCGYRNERYLNEPSDRIVDGDDAEPNEFPWMVAIFKRLPNNDLRYIGGGSIIHRSVILTAAHLVRRIMPENLVIRAGEHDIMDEHDNGKRQERNVSNIIIHEDLYLEGLINDVALIVLSKKFELTKTVSTICLPPQSIETNGRIMCTSSGWGKNESDRKGTYQAILKKIDLPIVGRGKCEHLLRRTRLGPYYNLNESLMCAGSGRRDTCKGDGGSPLVCEIPNDKGRFYQSGIVAGGIGCGSRVPGLYVNVGQFTNWITHQLGFIDLYFEPENTIRYESFD